MAMSRERFEALVARLESTAERSPRTYRVRVALLAALGFAWIFGVLAAVLLLAALVIAFMVVTKRVNFLVLQGLLVLGVLATAILRSLWVRFEAPEGLVITRREAPPLFDMIADVRRRLRAPAFHRVLITSEFNAAVMQVPRLGILGWQRNYLLVGLPLLQAFSSEHFRAVLAHEMGHLSGAHSRFSGWIYRLERTWDRLLESLHQEGAWGRSVFTWFFERYSPFFSAYTFALRRANEYEADRFSARLVGARTAAETLSGLPGGSRAHDRYWDGIRRSVATRELPPESLFGPMREAFAARDGREQWQSALAEALQEETGTADTHPALPDRLKALGHEPVLPEPPARSAAEALLGPSLPRITSAMDAEWRKGVEGTWAELHREMAGKRRELDALRAREAAGETLGRDDAWKLADYTEDLDGADPALPLFRRVLELDPAFAPAQFAVGRLLLEREDPAGVAHLERAMELEQEATPVILQRLYQWHRRRKDEEAARRTLALFDRNQEVLAQAQAERSTVSPSDGFLHHGLDEAPLAKLREQLAAKAGVAEAYLVRKRVVHLPDRPLYLLVVVRRRNRWKPESGSASAVLQQELLQTMEFPGECFVVIAEGDGRPFLNRVRAVDGSAIHPAAKASDAA